MRPHSLNHFPLSYAVTTTQASHPINLRKCPRYDQIWMILDQRNHAFVLGTVGVVIVSLVHENHRLPGSVGDELAHFFLRSDAGRGIVRVADVNQTLTSR